MLVLARKKEQSIIINDNIEIFIVEINADQVKIGVKAPREVSVHRKEVYEAIREENTAASETSGSLHQKLKNLTSKKKG